MQKFNIQPIDLVVVNLYPFRETIEKPNVTLAEAVENIDIGGPAMIRAAAKNFKFVTVVVNPKHYDEVAEMIAKDGCTTGKFRMQLAQEAFCHTSHYDDCIQEYLTAQLSK
jgi:phosphoribosylaminoimidazolecarboxamide formyltransferase/IMP cyclohydrolase